MAVGLGSRSQGKGFIVAKKRTSAKKNSPPPPSAAASARPKPVIRKTLAPKAVAASAKAAAPAKAAASSQPPSPARIQESAPPVAALNQSLSFTEITHDEIARRAYEIYRARIDATEFDDWVKAERELRAGKNGSP